MLILPAIDLIDGQCVRLRQGNYDDITIYQSDPVAVAREFVEQGAVWLHVVDLDGAKAGSPQPKNLDVLRAIRDAGLGLEVEYGGGMRQEIDITTTLAAGASRVILGSVLAKDREFARACFELGEKVVAGMDTRDGKVALHGWIDSSDLEGSRFAQELVELGCQRIIWTDIATDGMLQGPNLPGLQALASLVNIPVIASGGVSSLEDLAAISQIRPRLEGAIVGKAIYEGRFNVREAIAAVS